MRNKTTWTKNGIVSKSKNNANSNCQTCAILHSLRRPICTRKKDKRPYSIEVDNLDRRRFFLDTGNFMTIVYATNPSRLEMVVSEEYCYDAYNGEYKIHCEACNCKTAPSAWAKQVKICQYVRCLELCKRTGHWEETMFELWTRWWFHNADSANG